MSETTEAERPWFLTEGECNASCGEDDPHWCRRKPGHEPPHQFNSIRWYDDPVERPESTPDGAPDPESCTKVEYDAWMRQQAAAYDYVLDVWHHKRDHEGWRIQREYEERLQSTGWYEKRLPGFNGGSETLYVCRYCGGLFVGMSEKHREGCQPTPAPDTLSVS